MIDDDIRMEVNNPDLKDGAFVFLEAKISV